MPYLKKKKNEIVAWGPYAYRQLVGSTSAEKRETFITWYMAPLVARVMRKNTRVKAMYLGFAQYWNDEADDAVHWALLPVSSADLPVADICTVKNKCYKVDENGYGEFVWTKYSDLRKIEEDIHGVQWGFHWDNHDMIKAFAAYTEEDGSQERGYDQYTPYIKFYWREETRTVGNGKTHIDRLLVGEILIDPIRPWLDDTKTNWEESEEASGDGNVCDHCGLREDQHAASGQCLFESSQYQKDPESPFWFRKPIDE